MDRRDLMTLLPDQILKLAGFGTVFTYVDIFKIKQK